MRTLLFLIVLFLKSLLCHSQRESNVWHFGLNAGLNFNSGSPTNLSDGIIFTNEGCASICNSAGQLLFYTDGNVVRNRNHDVMPNGNNLEGNLSSTQSAIIVPKPNSSNIYYIFTIDAIAGNNGIKYSEVDMNLHNGFGAVTSQKNIFISTPVCEKICAVKNAAGNGYWVITHAFGDNSFISIEINASGVASMIFSPIGTIIDETLPFGLFATQGQLKVSPDGTKIVCVNGYTNVQLFDFDATTGVVSNVRTINNSSEWYCYGAEFSQLGSKLYLSGGRSSLSRNTILQYDLTSSNIPNSEIIISNNNNLIRFGSLQLASDGKIYCAKLRESFTSQSFLSVINNPEVSGAGCNFQLNQVGLSGISILGLPQAVQSIFEVSILYEKTCDNEATLFSVNGNLTIHSAQWDFGDGTASTLINPSHIYNSAGSYTVTAIFTTSGGIITRTKEITILPIPLANPVTTFFLCDASNAIFDLEQFNPTVIGNQSLDGISVSYFASNADAMAHENVLPKLQNLPFGEFTFYAKIYNYNNFNCYNITPITINLTEKPLLNPNLELIACDTFPYDNIEVFDLNTISNQIVLNDNPSNFNLSYHLSFLDAQNNSNPLALNYSNNSLIETLFVRAESIINSTCYTIETINLKVVQEPIISTITDFNTCEDSLPNDGITSFDLSSKKLEILNGQSSTLFDVKYYVTNSDAQNDLNPINTNFSNTTNPQTIYVRVFNVSSRNCYQVASFNLNVNPKPEFYINDLYPICEGSNSITISLPNIFSYYNWSTGENTASANISQPGNYTVSVGQQYGSLLCETIRNFTVVSSNAATIIKIDTVDFNNNNNVITINVSGSGDYEYSLDGISYQDSNSFYNLETGVYHVYVRDKNGCGITEQETYLLTYPHYFTPNNDGYNDYWKIKFLNNEPNSVIKIFDRYGKLIILLNSESLGWDGTLNNQQLPSDDYWFVIDRVNKKEFKGHFTLKR